MIAWACATWSGMLLAGALAFRDDAPPPARVAIAGRSAWTAAWAAAMCLLLLEPGAPVDLAFGLPAGAWTAACALAGPRRARIGIGAAAVLAFAALAAGPREASAAVCGLLAGSLSLHAAMSPARIRVRLALYWASFVGSFAVLVPLALRGDAPVAPVVPLPLLLVPIGAAVALAWAGTRAFLRSGGTPEPLDPPDRLATNGIYARVRHPIQIAEILFVKAGALAVGGLLPFAWSGAFALALIFPLRWYEEWRLARRFGDAWHAWRRATPAYFPR